MDTTSASTSTRRNYTNNNNNKDDPLELNNNNNNNNIPSSYPPTPSQQQSQFHHHPSSSSPLPPLLSSPSIPSPPPPPQTEKQQQQNPNSTSSSSSPSGDTTPLDQQNQKNINNNNDNNNTDAPTVNSSSIKKATKLAQEKIVTPLIQLATQTTLRLFSTSRNIKRFLSPVWSLIGACVLGYLFPIFYPSNVLILSIVGILFFLVGLSVPMREWASTLLTPVKVTHIIYVFASQFLIAPFIAISMLYVFRWFSSGTAATLARAFSVGAAATLPPSPSHTATLTTLAGGSDAFAFLISTLVNTVGIVLVPFLAQLTVTAAGLEETMTPGKYLGVSLREATQLISYLVLTTLIPLGLGAGVQNLLLANASSSSSSSTATTSNTSAVDSSTSSPTTNSSVAVSVPSSNEESTTSNNNSNPRSFTSLIESCCPNQIAMMNSTSADEPQSSSSNSYRKDHPQSLSYYDNSFEEDNQITELFGGRFFFSRARVRHWAGIVSFVLRYCCFILMFQQSQQMDIILDNQQQQQKTSFIHALADPASLLSWSQLLKTMLFSVLVTLVHSVICWFSSRAAMVFANSQTTNENPGRNHRNQHSLHTQNNNNIVNLQQFTEDRIALFLTCVQKSDLLIAPIYSYLFVSKIEGRVVVLMSHAFIFCFANTLVLALFAIGPLQEWKRRQLLKPGASFLPSKFSRIPSHHLALAPTNSGNASASGSYHQNNSNTSSQQLGSSSVSSSSRSSYGGSSSHRHHHQYFSHHHHNSQHQQQQNSLEMDAHEDSSMINNSNINNNNKHDDSTMTTTSSSNVDVVVQKVSANIQSVANNLVKSTTSGLAAALRKKSEHAKD